ncbi:catalase-related domain-containing protein, partial [Segetibacter sp.]|uniref:catalase-related domain-containing protein n=1 Tax=Segetibacter sp. TaxID=2231182 RepID=UPI002624B19F
ISNLVNALAPANKVIQDKMIELCTNCDPEYGQRVADGIKKAVEMRQQHGSTRPGSVERKEEAVKQAEEISTEAKPY